MVELLLLLLVLGLLFLHVGGSVLTVVGFFPPLYPKWIGTYCPTALEEPNTRI